MKSITTGVDKLVDYLDEHEKVRVKTAANELGVDKTTVIEWAELLEKEGLAKLSYGFSATYIEKAEVDAENYKAQAGEVSSKKDALERKIKTTIKKLQRDSANFAQVKKNFAEVQEDIKEEINTVKTEIEDLEKYDELRKTLSNKIKQDKENLQQELNTLESNFQKKQEHMEELIEEVESAKNIVTDHKTRLLSLSIKRDEIQKQVQQYKEEIEEVNKEIKTEQKKFANASTNIEKISSQINLLHKEFLKQKEEKTEALANKILNEKKMFQEEFEELEQKAKAKKEKVKAHHDAGKKIYGGFEDFFNKKVKAQKLIDNLEGNKDEIIKDLEDLRMRLKGLSVMQKNKKVVKEFDKIKEEFEEAQTKRRRFRNKLEKILDLIGL